MKLAALEALKAQIAELEWLLEKADFEPEKWRVKVTTSRQEGKLLLGLRLQPKTNRSIDLCCSNVHPGREAPFAGQHHYFIEGNHWYDRFAISTLRRRLTEAVEDEELE